MPPPIKYSLVCLFIVTSQLCWGAEKIQIEIVRATTTTQQFAADPHEGVNFLFDAQVILPDGSHAALICQAGDKGCAGIESFTPEKRPPESDKCDSHTTERGGLIMACVKTNLGLYSAERKGNYLWISTPKGKLKYHIVGSW
jgi:hypothetical protein